MVGKGGDSLGDGPTVDGEAATPAADPDAECAHQTTAGGSPTASVAPMITGNTEGSRV